MFAVLRRMFRIESFSWAPAVDWTNPRVVATLRTFPNN